MSYAMFKVITVQIYIIFYHPRVHSNKKAILIKSLMLSYSLVLRLFPNYDKFDSFVKVYYYNDSVCEQI